MKLFEESEFDNVNPVQISVKADEIRLRFQQRRLYYHQLLKTPYIDSDIWIQLSKLLISFDKGDFERWNSKWDAFNKQPNVGKYSMYFQEGNDVFSEMEQYFESFSPYQFHNENVEKLKEEILSELQTKIISLTSFIEKSVSKGIKNLIDLKAEYELDHSFSKSIEDRQKTSKQTKNWFLLSFILSIALIPALVLISFAIDEFTKIPINVQWGIRISSSITLGLLSVFLFSQYRIYQLINLKYSHQFNFIGGGTTFISELIGLEEDDKKELNKKVANMFIDIDDIMSSIKKNKHPTENAAEVSSKTFESITKNIAELLKAVPKNGS